jgi:integrase
MNIEKYIGPDVHQATISVAVLDSTGKLVMESILETKAATILEFLTGLRGTLSVTFEEGTWAAWLHDLLKPHVAKLVVCNPRKNALLKDGNKSDRIDAHKLAELLYLNKLSSVYHGETGVRMLRELARSYLTIVKDLTRVMCRLKAVYRSWAIPCAGRERVVGDDEFARYLSCASPLLSAVATVLNDTGLRPDECHRMDWSDIAFVNGRHGRLLVRHGKTKAARRQLPLTPRVRVMLQGRWENAGRPEEGWVWPAPTKTGHIDHSTLKKQHRNTLKLSGVRSFLLYSLRHTFATRIAPHVDAWTLCKIMGWSSLSVAMTYIHSSDDRVLEAFTGLQDGYKIGYSSEMQMLTANSDGKRTD